MKTFLQALLINLVLYGLVLTAIPLRYASNDDVWLMLITAGERTGEPSPYMIIPNVIIGQLLSTLFKFDSSTNWYTLYILTVHFLAMTAILTVWLRVWPFRAALLVYGLIFLGLELRTLLLLQFTSTAGLAAVAGGLLMFHAADTRAAASRYAFSILGIALLIVAALTRYNMCFLIAALLAPVIVLHACLFRRWQTVASFAIAGVIAMACVYYNNHVYQQQEQWRAYLDLHAARSTLIDYPSAVKETRIGGGTDPEYQRLNEFFREIGWTGNDRVAFRGWLFTDPNDFSADTLHTIVEKTRDFDIRNENWSGYLRWHLGDFSTPLLAAAVIFFAALFAAPRPTFREITLVVVLFSVSIAAMCYLAMYYKLVQRVTVPIIVNLAIIGAYCVVRRLLDSEAVAGQTAEKRFDLHLDFELAPARSTNTTDSASPEKPIAARGFDWQFRYRDLGTIATAIAAAMLLGRVSHDSNRCIGQTIASRSAYYELIDILRADQAADPDNPTVYLNWAGMLPVRFASPFSTIDEVRQLPFINLGWTLNSPVESAKQHRHGISNDPVADFAQGKNIKILAYEAGLETLETYIAEHYLVEIECEILASKWFPVAPPFGSSFSTVLVTRKQPTAATADLK